jgi:hypothetical protein
MSKIALSGNASGTGTFTIASPNSNTDRTLDLPDAAGTIQVSGNPISGTTGTFTGLVDISAAGAGQIKFPATQNASANANTLDDYEEGTWTPSVGGTATYTGQAGQYVKIGRQVTVFFDLQINVIGTGSQSTINNLPFVCSATATGQGGMPTYWASLVTSAVYISIRVDNGGNQVLIAGSTAATATLTAVFNCLGNSSRMVGTMTYTAA